MIADIGILVLGCAVLYVGADRMISGAFMLGQRFNLSAAVTGLVIVALGTSLPEMAVSLDAALHGYGAIAVGNVVGSNIVNLTLVVGAGALIGTLSADDELRNRDMPVLVGLTLLAVGLLLDGTLSALEGWLLLVCVSVYLGFRLAKQPTAVSQGLPGSCEKPLPPRLSQSQAIVWFGLGAVLLVLGAEAMVASALGFAEYFGVSEGVIALTVTAIGTGVPEIAATLLAIRRGFAQLALGNIIGSNLVNLGVVLGLTGLLGPLQFPSIGALALGTLAIMTVLLWAGVLLAPRLHRMTGLGLLAVFGAYQFALVA